MSFIEMVAANPKKFPKKPFEKCIVGYIYWGKGHPVSIEDQEAVIKQWAEVNGWPIGAMIKDRRKSKIGFRDRKVYCRAAALATTWESPLVVHSLDAACRSGEEALKTMRVLKFGFVSAIDRYIDTTHAGRDVIIEILELGCRLGFKQRRLMRRMKRVAYGWMRTTAGLAPKYPEQDWRRAVFLKFKAGWGYAKIANWLISQNAPSPGKVWSKAAVYNIVSSRWFVLKAGERREDFLWPKDKRHPSRKTWSARHSQLESISTLLEAGKSSSASQEKTACQT